MGKYGYARVSMEGPSLKEQTKELSHHGITTVFTCHSQSLSQRELYLLACLDKLETGDSLVVTDLTQIGYSTRQLVPFLQQLHQKGAHLISLAENINTLENPFYLNFLQQLTEMEGSLTKERTLIGLKEAREKGKIGGRPKISPKTVLKIRMLYFEKQESIPTIAQKCHVSVGSCYKYINMSQDKVKAYYEKAK